jgi:hypothetical protein
MKARFTLAATALLVSAGVAGAARTIVSSAIQTSHFDENAAACYVRNVGRSPISVHVEFLQNFSPGFITPDVDGCNGESPLAPGRTCAMLLNALPQDVTLECAATALTGNVKNLRGRAELRFVQRPGASVVGASDLR